MFTVVVDLSGIMAIKTLGLARTARAQMGLLRSAAYVQAVWVSCVQGNVLPPMSQPLINDEYAINIGRPEAIERTDEWNVAIVCTYRRARLIEDGQPSFDMKPGLLAGPHARMTKKGTRYNTVPFRHRTPLKAGERYSPGNGMQPPMPQDVYRVARTGATIRPGSIQAQYGRRTKLPPRPLPAQIAAAAAGTPLDLGPMTAPYTWQTGLYTGIVRLGDPKHRRYLTFRRVSERSNPNSWIMPARPPARIVEAVHQEASRVVPRLIRAAISG